MATPVIMPKLEMSQETATVVAWLKEDGQDVVKGEPLLTVETDKVTIDIECPASGVLAGVSAKVDDVVPVTETIAYVLQPGETLPTGVTQGPTPARATPVARRMADEYALDLDALAGTGPGGRITKADVEAAVAQTPRRAAPASGPGVRASPAARRVARERRADLTGIEGSGPRGRIQSADVVAYAGAAAGTPADEVVPLRGMRRTIADRMTASYQTTPHIALTVEVDMSAVQALRGELNARAEARGAPRTSVTAVLVKACAWALERHRALNASLHGDQIHLHNAVNIGVAIALEEGLIVPVIRQADKLGLAEIARHIRDYGECARDGTLVPQDVTGGTFTISNLGMYGISHFTAIINPPESAILAVGRIAKRSVVIERDGQDVTAIRPMANMTLSADHRVLDGAVAARFLQDLVDALECPSLLLW